LEKRSTSIPPVVEVKKQKLPIWPEWNENDVNAEKWDMGGGKKDTKPTRSVASATVLKYYTYYKLIQQTKRYLYSKRSLMVSTTLIRNSNGLLAFNRI
jgi:hypothetical protein